jgi:hypothetical protein
MGHKRFLLWKKLSKLFGEDASIGRPIAGKVYS